MKRKRISAKDIGYGLFFTFLVFLILILQKAFIQIYKKRVISLLFLYGNGFNTTSQKEYLSKEGKYLNL
jgi:hypothetical protein